MPMELGVSLTQHQQQRLLLLPRMLQAIEILQLSSRDLVALIDKELSENETLEVAASTAESAPSEPAAAVTEEPAWEDGEEWSPSARPISHDTRPDFVGQLSEHNVSLHAFLLTQLSLLELDDGLRQIVSFLIGSLDGNGHLMLEPDEIAAFFAQDAPVPEALAVLCSLEPCGVGQAGPRESMLAQIDVRDPDHDWLVEIVGHHLADLAANRLPKVSQAIGVSVDELKLLIAKLKGIEPCPGRAFATDEPSRVQPDVVVRREDGEWQIYVDDARVPPLAISEFYEALAADKGAPRRVRSYLREKLGSARELMEAIEQRRATLGRVARATIERQQAFLEKGPVAMAPLGMQEVADVVGVHLSTVSRATSDKFVQTDFGVFALRDLFDGGKAIGGSDGQGGESRAAVRDRIRRMVDGEDKVTPLSDEEIVRLLAQDGLDIARRTVAKYRKELGLASSWRRREH